MLNRLYVVPKEKTKEFIEKFNKSKPSKEFIESCKKAGKLFRHK